MSEKIKKDNSSQMYFPRSANFEQVVKFDDVISKIGEDGNIGALLVQMAKNYVIAPMYVDEPYREQSNIPFKPLILGDDDFTYVPFFDDGEVCRSWLDQFSQEEQNVVAPVVVAGSFLFSALSKIDNLNVVLNPHLASHQLVYHGNLVWIRNLVESEQHMHDAKTVVNMTGSLPDNANQKKLIEDLREYLLQTSVETAYFFVAESYNKETNKGERSILIAIDLPDEMSQELSDAMNQAFAFQTEKYGLESCFTLSFMSLPDTPAGRALIESARPFYSKTG